jgi:hypothetical protein
MAVIALSRIRGRRRIFSKGGFDEQAASATSPSATPPAWPRAPAGGYSPQAHRARTRLEAAKTEADVVSYSWILMTKERFVEKSKENADRSTWAIGGGLLIGLGVGFFFLQHSALAFVGCTLSGMGVGLTITSLISNSRKSG